MMRGCRLRCAIGATMVIGLWLLQAAWVPAVVQAVESRIQDAKALECGVSVRGTIDEPQDEGWYGIDAEEGEILHIEFRRERPRPTEVDYTLSLYDGEGNRFYRRSERGRTNRHTYLYRHYVPHTGPWYLSVSNARDDTADPESGYILTVTRVETKDPHEPNSGETIEESMLLATPLEAGKTIKGYLDFSRDEDWFVIDGEEDQLLDVVFRRRPPRHTEVSHWVTLFDADGQEIINRVKTGRSSIMKYEFRHYMTSSEQYFIRVRGRDRDVFCTDVGYDLTVDIVPTADPHEPNSGPGTEASMEMATVLASGQTVRACLDFTGDVDWYRIDAPGGSLVDVRFERVPHGPHSVDYRMNVLDAGGTVLAHHWETGRSSVNVYESAVDVHEGGPTYIRIWSHGTYQFERTNHYDLTATVMVNPDRNEPNRGPNREASMLMATPLPPESRLQGYVQSVGDQDHYVMDHEGGELWVDLTNAPAIHSPVEYRLKIYDKDNQRYFTESRRGSFGTVSLSFREELPPGRYYASVRCQNRRGYDYTRGYTIAHGIPAFDDVMPRILRFHADPKHLTEPGMVNLSWKARRLDWLRLRRSDSDEVFDVRATGHASVRVNETTTFTLKGVVGSGRIEDEVVITVGDSPPMDQESRYEEDGSDAAAAAADLIGDVAEKISDILTSVGDVVSDDEEVAVPDPPPGEGRRFVVLSHGWKECAEQMKPLQRRLRREGFEAHAIDYRGNLLRDNIDGYARELRDFIARLDLDPTDTLDLVGYSMGGVISCWYAEKVEPQRKIGSIMTVCSPHHGTAWGLVTGALKAMLGIDPSRGTASDVMIGSPTVQAHRNARRDDISYGAIWLPTDLVALPGQTALISGARNYRLTNPFIRHVTAMDTLPVLDLVVDFMAGRPPPPMGPQSLSNLEMFRLGLLDEDDFDLLSADEQFQVIDDIVQARIVWRRAERSLVRFLQQAHPGVVDRVDRRRFYRMFQGRDTLQELYRIFGPVSPIECAIIKNRSRIATRDVGAAAIRASSSSLLVQLLRLLLRAPVLNPAENLILDILRLRSAEAQDLARRAGGIQLFYRRIQGRQKRELRRVLPWHVTCPRCDGSGTIRQPQTCPQCNGSGNRFVTRRQWSSSQRRFVQVRLRRNCLRCGGNGLIRDILRPRSCPRCDGSGRIQR